MNNKKWLALSPLVALCAFAAPALAASWVIENKVTQVNVKDNTSAGGTGTVLELTFAAAGSFCGSSSTIVSIPRTGHSLWSEWVKVATAAQLSGKTLRIGTNDATGSCKVQYLRLQD